VGVLKPRKGLEALIRGFALFQKQHPNAELVIVGSDPVGYRASIERHIVATDMSKHVRLVGKISDTELCGWYRACDVFALTPVNHGGIEGFGLVYLEAAAFGKPSVGSLDSGAAEAIRQGASGILCDPTDPAEIAAALTRAQGLAPATIRAWAEENAWPTRGSAYRAVFESVSG
jgi:phosphatidylinositol alpha-1,6-mannosyltransferase